MKLERIPEYLTVTAVTLIGMLLSIYCGQHTGLGDMKSVGIILGAIIMIMVVVQMRTRVWLLIPICWPLTVSLNYVPGHIPPRDVAILVVFGAFLFFKALKLSRIKPTYGWLDLVMLINILYVLSVYIRNPVGTLGVGADKVGGRPYVEIIFALLAYWVMVRIRIDPKLAQKLPFLMIAGWLFEGLIGLVCSLAPSAAPIIGKIYGSVGSDLDAPVENGGEGIARDVYLANPSASVFRLFCSRYTPTSLFKPTNFYRFILTCLCFLGALKSGFRIAVISMIITFIVALYFRKGFASIIVAGLLSLPFFGLLIGLQGNVIQLPLPAQRALSFLPGKWDPVAVANAQASSQWRFEIWRSVLGEGNKYISDKVWGDGFGFTRRQLEEMVASNDAQENFRITGDYHSGPVSSIRFVGYIGLALFYVFLLGLALKGWRLVRKTEGSPYYYLALFSALPVIVMPITFTFIFGAYQTDIVGAIFSTGFFNMLSNSFSANNQVNPAKSETRALPVWRGRRELEWSNQL